MSRPSQSPSRAASLPAAIVKLGRNRYRIPAGVRLFKEGDPGTGAYLIESGRVDLTKVVRGQDVLLATAVDGEIIGEMALIDGQPRSATATTASETVVTTIPAAHFRAHLSTLDPVAQALLRKFVRIIRNGNDAAVLRPMVLTGRTNTGSCEAA